jgi:ATP-binding cassette, subfamily B, bacterial PglK
VQPAKSIPHLLRRLWHHISPRRRKQFGLLLILMLLASFAEILSIGAVIPFLGVLTTPERIFQLSAVQPLIQALKLTEPAQLLLPITVAFGAAALIAGAMRLMLLWTNTRLSYAAGADISINIYRRTLFQPYSVHCARNSSEIINAISTKTNAVIGIIISFLTLIGSTVMLVTILVALFSVEPLIALTAFGGFGLIYAVITYLTRKKLSINSNLIARKSNMVIKSLQEGLGGIRDVLINGSQAIYCQIYRNADLPVRRAQGSSAFIAGSPRYAVEALGMMLIAALAYSLSKQTDGIVKAIPVLGAMVLGAQRLLPVLQQAYAAWSVILGSQDALHDTIELLDQPLPEYADQPAPDPLPFKHSISLKQLGFRYSPETPYVLKKLNLTITKGSRLGFIGTTGSGKSTLLDIVMGLLQPSDGKLEIDSQAVTPSNSQDWQSHISHVPQTIFLADSTIEENIAFGVLKNRIDPQLVRQAAQQAQIADIIESWPKQYQTFVGERGIRLSGGQRQRIGIARALYKQADVIIFDEATSSLDNQTEQSVMQAIEELSKDLTLLIIAHRLTSLKNCTQIVELGEGGIRRVGSYQDIVNKSALAPQKNEGSQGPC